MACWFRLWTCHSAEEARGWLAQDDTLLEPVELGRKHHRVLDCLDSVLADMAEA